MINRNSIPATLTLIPQLLLGLVFVVAAIPALAAEDIRIKEFYKMSPSIKQISQICPWRSSTTKGTIRLMKTEDKGAHRLYVQWLREGIAGTEQAPLSTISIEEINNDHYYRFELPEGRLMAGACSIETIMEDIVDESRYRLTLYLMGPGEYEVHTTRLLDGGIKLNKKRE
jgi:hypothetical protein